MPSKTQTPPAADPKPVAPPEPAQTATPPPAQNTAEKTLAKDVQDSVNAASAARMAAQELQKRQDVIMEEIKELETRKTRLDQEVRGQEERCSKKIKEYDALEKAHTAKLQKIKDTIGGLERDVLKQQVENTAQDKKLKEQEGKVTQLPTASSHRRDP